MHTHHIRKLILGILLLICIFGNPVQADATHPPDSIKICGYITYCNEIGVWWINPHVTDFNGVQIWFDNVYETTTSPAAYFYNPNTAIIGDHTISTHTVDAFNNTNSTWVNITVNIAACPSCSEGWFCADDEFCVNPNVTPTITPTPTVSVTPTSWINQTYNATTDICTIRADMGETWIRWDANCNTTVEVLYYIDGKKLENTTPYEKLDPNRLILSDLKAGETHDLKIYYLGTIVAESTIKTLPSWLMILFFIVLSITLSVTALLFISSPPYRIMLSSMALAVALWMFTVVTGWMLMLPLLPALLAVIGIILALRDQIDTSWE